MKKAGQTILIVALSFFLISSLPSVVFAAWYNPFTWFKQAQTTSVVEDRSKTTTASTSPAKSDPGIQYIEKPVIKEVVRTVTQTVEDPAIRQQLNDALAKNNQLTSQIQESQNLIKQYESANLQLDRKYADAVGVAAQCVGLLKSQPTYTTPPTIRCTSNTSTYDGTTFTVCN